jgi:hypothetical protein
VVEGPLGGNPAAKAAGSLSVAASPRWDGLDAATLRQPAQDVRLALTPASTDAIPCSVRPQTR